MLQRLTVFSATLLLAGGITVAEEAHPCLNGQCAVAQQVDPIVTSSIAANQNPLVVEGNAIIYPGMPPRIERTIALTIPSEG